MLPFDKVSHGTSGAHQYKTSDPAINPASVQKDSCDLMKQDEINLKNSVGTGYILPLGPVNLVWVIARRGLVGCGAFDVAALEKFGYPAARVRPAHGDTISSLEDLVSGVIKEANIPAQQQGVSIGMSGKEALDLLS
jgi:uncharacterized protein YunC (DUF1805 family)